MLLFSFILNFKYSVNAGVGLDTAMQCCKRGVRARVRVEVTILSSPLPPLLYTAALYAT